MLCIENYLFLSLIVALHNVHEGTAGKCLSLKHIVLYPKKHCYLGNNKM